jgi:hypothetical protein
MGKYEPLGRFLEKAPPGVVRIALSFGQIEQILNDALPYTARHQGSWWANELRSGTYPQSSSWLDTDWVVDAVDTADNWVRFRRFLPDADS